MWRVSPQVLVEANPHIRTEFSVTVVCPQAALSSALKDVLALQLKALPAETLQVPAPPRPPLGRSSAVCPPQKAAWSSCFLICMACITLSWHLRFVASPLRRFVARALTSVHHVMHCC
jgi:hypothetical protein